MSVRWKHKPFSKENNTKSLCLGLAGAGFLKDKNGNFDLKKITFLVLGLFVLIGFVYLISAVQEISTVTLNSTLGTNFSNENLTAYVSPFNSSQKYIYVWKKDGVIQRGFNDTFFTMNFDENREVYTDTVARDLSGNNYHADTFGAGTSYSSSGGIRGGYYNFSADSQVAKIQTNTTPGNDLASQDLVGATIAAWFNPADATPGQGILAFDDFNGNGELAIGLASLTQTRVHINDSVIDSGGVSFAAGTWNHMAMTWNESSGIVKLYINGNFFTNVVTDTGPIDFGTADKIGIGLLFSDAGDFDGKIDEPSIWINKVLTPQEINDLFNLRYFFEYDFVQSNSTSVNEIWQVCVTPSNDAATGSEVCSNNLTVLASDLSCPSTPQNWNVDMSEYFVVNSVCNITGYNITFSGVGNFTVNSTIYVDQINNLSSNMTVWMKPDGVIFMGSV